MSEGGEVKPFCSENRPHQPSCEYYNGGEVSQNVLPGISAESLNQTQSALAGLIDNPNNEASKWALGIEDKDEAIASALSHAGGYHLLAGTMKGAYADPNEGLRKLADRRVHKRLTKYMAGGGMVESGTAQKITSGHPSKLAPVILNKMLSNNSTEGFANLLAHASNVHHGKRLIKDSVEGVFSGKPIREEANLDERKKLAEYMDQGGLGKQIDSREIFKGTGPMEKNFPEHNIALQEAKGRVATYLNTLRPVKSQSSYPFDSQHESQSQKRSYNEALDMANRPTRVFDLIKKGRLTSEQVGHLNSMYPGVADHYRQKLTEQVLKAQMSGKKPDYRVRQSLSLFLGAPLDSTFTPGSMQAAQATFIVANQQKQQSPPKPSKKTADKMDKMAMDNRTPDQAAQMRQLKI